MLRFIPSSSSSLPYVSTMCNTITTVIASSLSYSSIRHATQSDSSSKSSSSSRRFEYVGSGDISPSEFQEATEQQKQTRKHQNAFRTRSYYFQRSLDNKTPKPNPRKDDEELAQYQFQQRMENEYEERTNQKQSKSSSNNSRGKKVFPRAAGIPFHSTTSSSFSEQQQQQGKRTEKREEMPTLEQLGKQIGGPEEEFISRKKREVDFVDKFNKHVDEIWYESKPHLKQQDRMIRDLGSVEAAVRETLQPSSISFREELRRRPIDRKILEEIHHELHGRRSERMLRKGMKHERWIAQDDANYPVIQGTKKAKQLFGFGGEVNLVSSAKSVQEFPVSNAPEIAFIGRTSCGRSSLINALLNAFVAKHGVLPGTTATANFYNVSNGRLMLVDLPGYGYYHPTQTPQAKAQNAVNVMRDYLLKCSQSAYAVSNATSASSSSKNNNNNSNSNKNNNSNNRSRSNNNNNNNSSYHDKGGGFVHSAPRNIKRVFLCTSSVGLSNGDLAYAQLLERHRIPFGVIMTKTDLPSVGDLARIADYTRCQLVPFTMCNELLMANSLRLAGISKVQNLVAELARSSEKSSGENAADLDMTSLV